MRIHRARSAGIVMVAGMAALALAGCSHASDKAASAGPPQVDGSGTTKAAGSGSSDGSPSGAQPSVDLAVAQRPATDRQVISNAQLDLETRDLDATIGRATAVVVDAGGYTFAETASLTSGRHAHVVFKVPPERFAGVVARIGRLGTLVRRRIGTEDVTGRVVDLDARLQAAQTSANRLRELLSNSAGVADLLNVEGQLTTREGQVDALAGDLAALRAQVDMATVTLDLSPTSTRAASPPSEQPGFQRGLRAGASAFAGTARVLEATVGILLPFLLFALPAGLAWWWFLRRRGRAGAPAS